LYNVGMANRAYVGAWAKDYSAETQHAQFGRLLETVPLPEGWPGFSTLIVRAIDAAESPVREWDLRSQQVNAAEILELLREHSSDDMAFEVHAPWELWIFDLEAGAWKRKPQVLEITSMGPEYDGGIAAELGDFLIDIGFEHIFTGHAGLLGNQTARGAESARPEEERFLAAMNSPERLREYHQRTRENIQFLFRWLQEAEAAVPLDRYRLWSEGEENFEARVDEILAVG
jgi:hypothetical protein